MREEGAEMQEQLRKVMPDPRGAKLLAFVGSRSGFGAKKAKGERREGLFARKRSEGRRKIKGCEGEERKVGVTNCE